MKRLLQWIWSQSWLTKGTIAAAILFAAFLFYGWGKGTVYDLRSWLFERRQAEVTERERKLETERNEAIKRAEIAEARAADKEAEASALRGLIESKGGDLEREQERLQNELKEINSERDSCSRITNPRERTECVCRKLAREGFPCA